MTSRTVTDKNASAAASGALLDSGTVRLYSGTPPASASDPLSGNDELAQGGFSATAFGSPSNGTVTSNAISNGTGTPSAGVGTVATFARTLQTDGTTVTRQVKVFPSRSAAITISATATGFDDSADALFTEIQVGDQFIISGFTNASIDGRYIVVGKTDAGTIATYPAPVAIEAAGQSISFVPDGMILDNTTIAESQTVTFSNYSISSLDLQDLG